LNIDECRIETDEKLVAGGSLRINSGDERNGAALGMFQDGTPNTYKQNQLGRFPANVILDEEVGVMLDEQSGVGASRFFYCAKAHKKEKNLGLDKNNHPTVKPVKLMRYLCRLITPPNGTILDPFMGSGTTGIGAMLERFDFIGIEMEEEYLKIAEARIEAWKNSDR
jgi:site-specific DNA-methyltransferase (adenine-specific)